MSEREAVSRDLAMMLGKDRWVPATAHIVLLIIVLNKISGLRDAAKGDLPPPAATNSDAADAQVLNAPAIEDIEPQFNSEVHRYIEYFTGAGRSVFVGLRQ